MSDVGIAAAGTINGGVTELLIGAAGNNAPVLNNAAMLVKLMVNNINTSNDAVFSILLNDVEIASKKKLYAAGTGNNEYSENFVLINGSTLKLKNESSVSVITWYVGGGL